MFLAAEPPRFKALDRAFAALLKLALGLALCRPTAEALAPADFWPTAEITAFAFSALALALALADFWPTAEFAFQHNAPVPLTWRG